MPLLAVLALALAARLLFVFGADEPLLYSHQYTYFTNALRIAEHPHALAYVLRSDEWRTWDQHWTIAPLYHLFAAGIFRLFGPHLLEIARAGESLDEGAAGGGPVQIHGKHRDIIHIAVGGIPQSQELN